MAINFPNSPAVNDTFTVGGINFTFTGVKWESGAVVELSSDTTPTLGGNLDGGGKNINNVGVITATGLDVNGNADISGNLSVHGTTTTIDTAVTEVDSLAVEGSVGIGTDNPQRKLVVSDNGTEGLEFFPGDAVNGSTINVYNRATSAFTPFSLNAQDYRFNPSGGTEALRITSDGKVRVPDNGKFIAGAGDDLEIFHDGTDNIIKSSTAALKIQAAGSNSYTVHVSARPDKETIICYNNTNTPYVELYYNNTKKFETSASGVAVTGSIDLPNVNSYITGNGHNVLQVDATRTYFYGGTNGVQLRTADNSSEIVTVDNVGNAVFDGTISDSIGPLRRLGIQSQSDTYDLVAGDAGKFIRMTGSGKTISVNQNVFTAGDMITIFNVSTGNCTINQASGVAIYNSADGTTGTKTLAAKGVLTLLCTASNEFIMSGSQIS